MEKVDRHLLGRRHVLVRGRQHRFGPLALGISVAALFLAGPVLVSLSRLGNAPRSIGSQSVPHLVAWYDLPTLILILDAALASAMLMSQWRLMSTLHERLAEAKSLHIEKVDESSVANAFARAERWLDNIKHPLAKVGLFVFALFCARVLYGQVAVIEGFYDFLVPPPLASIDQCSMWQRHAYWGWWASGTAGKTVWIATMGTGLFFVLIHIMTGFVFFVLARQVARYATYGVNIYNADGHFGRRSVRDLLLSFYVGFLSYTTSILVIVSMVRLQVTSLIVFIAVPFLVLNPFFIYWPIATLHRHARKSIDVHSERLMARLGHVDDDLGEREAVQVQLDRLHRIPTALFRWPGLLAGIVGYTVPTALSVAQAFASQWLPV